MDKVIIIPFGSGSTGNSIYIEFNSHRFLVDMGIGYRKIRDALAMHNRDMADIEAIFLTHGHYDHVKSASAISNHTACPVYALQSSMYPIRNIKSDRIAVDLYESFEPAESLSVTAFPVSHDYVQTCGFVFESGGIKIGYVTDCGKMNETIFSYLQGSDIVIIESNHDIEMLKNGPYPRQLQQRILSRFGHLSNIDCAETIDRLYSSGTRHFLLAHLSRVNNTPEIAFRTSAEKMAGKDVTIDVCPEEGDEIYEFFL